MMLDTPHRHCSRHVERRPATYGLLAGLLVLLSGCASFSPDGGMTPVSEAVSSALSKDTLKIASSDDMEAVAIRVHSILQKQLSADAAVQIALLNNRGLQAEYNALGIAEAAYVAASLPPSPTLSIQRTIASGDLEIERRLAGNVLALLTLPARTEIAETDYRGARYRTIEATFRLAAQTRRAYYRAVAARQTVGFLEHARGSADAAADLTMKLGEAGTSTKLEQARASAFYAEVAGELAQARLKAMMEREGLTRLMGLWGQDIDYKLPDQLPSMPPKPADVTDLESQAVRKRVDLIAARLELEAKAKSLGLTHATRAVSMLTVTGVATDQTVTKDGVGDATRLRGFDLEVEIPIFDLGETANRKAIETYTQAVNRLLERSVNVRSDVRAAYVNYRATRDISMQYAQTILPLRKLIRAQSVLQYNGMLIDIFNLLTTARESVSSNVAAIAAKRDALVAAVDLQSAIIGGGSSSSPMDAKTSTAPQETAD